ncbi:MAG: MATE family efflux transporter [Firmicutes bacterium]|nr:MATE family efflux transporter [Bacillota bacterium]
MNEKNLFTSGPILGPLIRFSLPVLLALFLQALYGAVDLFVVGKFATAMDVSGVAIGSQLMTTITNLISSFSMGTTILLGRKIGEGDRDSGGRIIGTSIIMFLTAGLFLSVLVPLLSGSLASVMQAPEESFDTARRYILICGAGSVMIVAYNAIGSVMRGLGDSNTPLMTVAIAAVVNIAGDLILIAGLHMGAMGAALATVIAQTVSVIISLLVLSRRKLPFTLTRKELRIEKPFMRKIIRLGTPIALQDLLVGMSFLILLAIVNTLGLISSAGVGVAVKVCAFIMLAPLAFMQSMSAYVAQNYGAGRIDRAMKGLKIAIGISVLFGFCMFWLSFFHGDLLCSVFSSDPDVIAAGYDYLKAYAIDCLLTCFLFCFIGFYNGLGYTGFVMLQGISAAFLIRIPFAWLMCRMTGRLFYIGLGIPCSTVFQITLCFLFFAYIKKNRSSALYLE